MNFNWLKTVLSTNKKQVRQSGASRKSNSFRPRVLELECRRVLAAMNLYVDDTFAGTSPNLVWNSGRFDQVGGLTTGVNAFTDINAAIATANQPANTGSTIFIGTGTFNITTGTVINTTTSIVGSQASINSKVPISIVNPTGDTPAFSGAGSGWITINAGANVNVTTLIVDGLSTQGFNTAQALRYEATGTSTISNVTFRNIGGDFTGIGFGNKYIGAAISDLAGTVNVINSRFNNITREGIVYSGATAAGTVTNITYTGKGAGDLLDYGVEANEGANVTVTASTFTGNLGETADGFFASAGILASDPVTVLKAYGNLFTNNAIGLIAGIGDDVTADSTTIDAQYNNFVDNVLAVQTNLITPAVLTNNWWNSRTGATAGTGANNVDDGDSASTVSSFLFGKTWVWNGTSPANYLINTSFFSVANELGDAKTSATLRVFASTAGTTNKLGVTTGNPLFSTFPFTVDYKGGLSTDIGDYDGDYRPDVVVGVRRGDSATNPHVKVFDLATGVEKASFFAFNASTFATTGTGSKTNGFNGGANVRFGDLNGDGTDEVITAKGPDAGAAAGAALRAWGNPTVGNNTPALIFSQTLAQVFSQTPKLQTFTGSLSVGTGDLDGGGNDEIIIGTESLKGFGSRLDKVTILSYAGGGTGTATGTIPPNGVVTTRASFNAIADSDSAVDRGIFVDGGDLNGDGRDELLVSTDSGGTRPARVQIFSLNASFVAAVSSQFYVYQAGYQGGARIASARVNGTREVQILVGTGPQRNPSGNGDVRLYARNATIAASGYATPVVPANANISTGDFNVFGPLLAGVHVGG